MRLRRGFTLVELLVVIGIIAVLVGILLPALGKARKQAQTLLCLSNMRQIGSAMLMYAGENSGYLFPTDAGGPFALVESDKQWYVYVLKVKPPVNPLDMNPWLWEPAIVRCPTEALDREGSPEMAHSYVLNDHVNERKLKYSSKPANGMSNDQVVLMGEKLTSKGDWYVQVFPPGNVTDYGYAANASAGAPVVELYRHGLRVGSNYLYKDLHAGTSGPMEVRYPGQLDPWDPG